MNEPLIHWTFRATAERFPDHPAIEEGELRIGYRELEARSNEIAAELMAAGIEAGAPVILLSGRRADVIAGMIGILKAGGAFLPLDPGFPLARMEDILSQVSPRWALVESRAARLWRSEGAGIGFAGRVIELAESWQAATPASRSAASPAELPLGVTDTDAMAYLYFTSGSTGRPKGIAGRLRGVDHFVRWEIETFGVGEGTRVSQLTTPAFDAFLRDVFVPLTAGGTVCVPPSPDTVMDGSRLAEWIDQSRVSLVHCTPSVFRSVLGQPLQPSQFQELRHVLLAGEPLLPGDVARWYDVFGSRIELVNLYGPTETTMTKLFHRIRPEDARARTIPVGRPMPGAKAIVVDEQGRPCPPGKLGEIYIRTRAMTLGYWNQPELTREVFIQNPFSETPGDMVYKTGDLGRVREDGTFEVVGRRDQQVKIRGMRVELGPIEDRLRAHEAVREVAVIDRDDSQGNKLLCAYVVLNGEVETSRLREWLLAEFAEALVPSAFVVMEALPRTFSGKLDRRALPQPGTAGGRLGSRGYVPPGTPVEEMLCAIYGELLNLPRVGIHDSFFELGGHSLLATLLLSRIRSGLGVEVPLREVFRNPTVSALALVVTQLKAETEGDISDLIREIEELSEEELEGMVFLETKNREGRRNGIG